MKQAHTYQSKTRVRQVVSITACLFLSFFLGFSSQAQSLEQRREIQKSINTAGLGVIKAEFLQQYQQDEASVAAYLARNPLVERSFEKDGSVYFLVRVDDAGNPVFINTKNRESGQLIKADQLYSGGSLGVNITGTGMVAGVWDGGQVRTTHELLSGRVTMQPGQPLNTAGGNNHMTHVSGTMVGKDVSAQPSARGIAHNATARCYDWDNDKTEMADFAGLGFLISNHSYGYGNTSEPEWQFGAYDAESRAWDALLKNTPNYLPFVAAGNEQQMNGNASKMGYDVITGSSASKNVMTVGAVNGDKTMSDYSNWGPTDDGRVKPEIVTKGTGINSAQYTSDNAYSGNGESSSGTSYAAPAAAAAGLLLQQYYNSLHGAYLKASTLKALMLHTAEDLGQPGPDPKFGWGLLNVEKAAQAIKAKGPAGQTTSTGAYIEEIATNPINNSADEITRDVYASGTEPLVVSIAWTDDEGTEQTDAEGVDPSTSRLVYEFDILVRQVSNSQDRRPWKPQTMAGRTMNATLQTSWFDGNGNTYKQVVFPTTVANGQYTIYIRKKSTSPATARTISLVVTGLKVNAASSCVLTAAPGEVQITNSSCGGDCAVFGGAIAPPAMGCPSGSSIQYRVNSGAWSTTLPSYNQTGPAQTIQTRCTCDTNPNTVSPASAGLTTAPGTCGPAAPTGALAITNSTCNNCVASGGSIALGSLSGPGGTLQYATDGGQNWSNTLPAYNQTGPAQTILASVLDANGCRSNSTQVGVTAPAVCSESSPLMLNCINGSVNFNGQSSITLMAASLVQVSGGCQIQSITANPASIACAQVGQTVPVTITVTEQGGGTSTCTSNVTVTGLPCGWGARPGGIGCVAPCSNNFAYNSATDTWTGTAVGAFSSPPYNADTTLFAQHTLCGNGSISVQVTQVSGNGWAGIAMRESNAPGARKAQLSTSRHTLSRREFRLTTNGSAYPQQFASQGKYWLRLLRVGNQVVGYTSANGDAWSQVFVVTIPGLPGCIEVGLVVANGQDNNTVTASFSDLSLVDNPNLSSIETPGTETANLNLNLNLNPFPNPTSGEVTVDFTPWAGQPALLEVYDLQGRRVHRLELDEATGLMSVDMSQLPSGVYLFRVGEVQQRVVLQR